MAARRPSRHQLATFAQHSLIWLGQPRWQIHLLDKREDGKDSSEASECWAETRYSQQRYAVTLWISDHIVEKADAQTQRETLLHEALHAVHVGIDRVVWGAQSLMHDQEHDDLFGRYHLERELMVDALSMALADTAEIKKLWREATSTPATS